jgi:hypothetical protein
MTSRLCLGLAAAALTLALSPAFAGADDDAFVAATRQFQLAMRGDEAAVEPAAERFAALSQAAPADPVLLAYAGAAQAMKARSAWLPWRRMSRAEDGLALIDKALAMLQPAHNAPLHRGTPASLETRFVAASAFLGLPEVFHRETRGSRLLDEVQHSPLLAQAPLPFRGAVWMRAADLALKQSRIAEARQGFEQIVSQAAPQAEQARLRLKELP